MRDGAAHAERVADSKDDVALHSLGRVRKFNRGEVFCVDFYDSQVGFRIGADHLGFVLLVVIEQGYYDLVGIFHDVVVRDDIAVLGDDDARSQRASLALSMLRNVEIETEL